MPVGDAVAPPQAAGGKPTGHPRRTVPDLLVRDPLAAENDDAFAVRGPLDGVAEHVEQRLRKSRVAQHAIVGALDPRHVERHDRGRSSLFGDHPGPLGIDAVRTRVSTTDGNASSAMAASRFDVRVIFGQLGCLDACAQGRRIGTGHAR